MKLESLFTNIEEGGDSDYDDEGESDYEEDDNEDGGE